MNESEKKLIKTLFYGDSVIYYEMVDSDGIRRPMLATRKLKDNGDTEVWQVTFNRRLFNKIKELSDEPDISLCRCCWCMTRTLSGNVCGKCKQPKHIVVVIGDESIGGESRRLRRKNANK